MERYLQKLQNPHEQNEFDTVFVDPFEGEQWKNAKRVQKVSAF